jgi:hypothetical protein
LIFDYHTAVQQPLQSVQVSAQTRPSLLAAVFYLSVQDLLFKSQLPQTTRERAVNHEIELKSITLEEDVTSQTCLPPAHGEATRSAVGD